jgi:predicted nucleic acid-binding protein
VLAWIRSIHQSELFLSSVTMGELQRGVEITLRQDPVKGREIAEWIDRLASVYEVLVPDTIVFREWARLMYGRPEDKWEDVLIASTARRHRMMVVTRNVRDFEGLGVEVLNPFPSASGGQD